MSESKVGPNRPLFVLFGSSIVQLSYFFDGWGAYLTGRYARKVLLFVLKKLLYNVHQHYLYILFNIIQKLKSSIDLQMKYLFEMIFMTFFKLNKRN